MKQLVAIAGTLFILACVSTQVTNLAGFDPARAPTCVDVVKVYASAEAIGTPFVEIALLSSSATDPVENDKLVKSMKEKAAAVGANGILLKGFGSKMGGPGYATSAFVAKPTGEALAIWIPRDSSGLQQQCQVAADSAAARNRYVGP
jgi:hypothetical protein